MRSSSTKPSLAPDIAPAARRTAMCVVSRIFEDPALSLHSSHRSSSRAAHSDTNGALCPIPSSITPENMVRLSSEGEPLQGALLDRVSTVTTLYSNGLTYTQPFIKKAATDPAIADPHRAITNLYSSSADFWNGMFSISTFAAVIASACAPKASRASGSMAT